MSTEPQTAQQVILAWIFKQSLLGPIFSSDYRYLALLKFAEAGVRQQCTFCGLAKEYLCKSCEAHRAEMEQFAQAIQGMDKP